MQELNFPVEPLRHSWRNDLLYGLGIVLAAGIAVWAFDRFTYLDRLVKKGAVVRYVQKETWDRPVPWLLELKGEQFDNGDLRLIRTVPTLTKIDVSNSLIDDEGLAMFVLSPGLRELNLSGTAVTDRSLEFLTRVQRLREIDLSHCPQVTYFGLTQLRKCREMIGVRLHGFPLTSDELNELELSVSWVIDIDPGTFLGLAQESPITAAWSGSKGDRRISLGIRQGISQPRPVTVEDLAAISYPDRVESLDLSYAALQTGAFASLSRFTRSAKLSMPWDGTYEGKELPALRQMRCLKELSIRLRPDAVWEKGEDLPTLEKLHVSVGAHASVGPALLASCPNLTELSITSHADLDEFITALSRLPKLRSLHLWCPQMTDTDVSRLAGITTLERLWITSNNLTPRGLTAVCTLPRLDLLVVDGEGVPRGHGIPWLDGPSAAVAEDFSDTQ